MFHDLSRTNILATIIFSLLTCYFACLRPDILVTGISSVLPYYFTSSGTVIPIKGFSSLVLRSFTYLRPGILSQKYRLYSEISWLVDQLFRSQVFGPCSHVTSPLSWRRYSGSRLHLSFLLLLHHSRTRYVSHRLLLSVLMMLHHYSRTRYAGHNFYSCDTLRDLSGRLHLAKQGQCNLFICKSSIGADILRVL
jgi:hypothetical protein